CCCKSELLLATKFVHLPCLGIRKFPHQYGEAECMKFKVPIEQIILGVPMADRSKTLDFELEIAQVQILSVTHALLSVPSTSYCIDSPPYSV
ncbi:hypothetical protein J6590_105088, partial [Homalodisca vitripennis]